MEKPLSYEEKQLINLFRNADERAKYDALRILERHPAEKQERKGIIIELHPGKKKAED